MSYTATYSTPRDLLSLEDFKIKHKNSLSISRFAQQNPMLQTFENEVPREIYVNILTRNTYLSKLHKKKFCATTQPEPLSPS
jgi:hypothetical protein